MTNTLSILSTPPAPAEVSTSPAPPPQRAAAPAEGTALAQSEAVTLSAEAQTTTRLLTAAREAEGVDQASVARIRSALQNGTYNVSPDDLAQAIAAVLKEST